jgi:hypothetical protein
MPPRYDGDEGQDVLDQVDRLLGRHGDRDDLVVVAVRDEDRDVEGLEVLGGARSRRAVPV